MRFACDARGGGVAARRRRRLAVLAGTMLALAAPARARAATCGDADASGVVDVLDAANVLRAAVGLPSACAAHAAECDVDGSGLVDVVDAANVLRAAVDLPAAQSCPAEIPGPGDPLSGGATTVFDVSRSAFSFPARNLSSAERPDFFTGNALFNRNWVTAPASTTGQDGLGPTFNARSCSACHFKDGRGRPPIAPEEASESLLVRLSVPGTDEVGGPVADPRYGLQLNGEAILGVPAEGAVTIAYVEEPGTYGDGDPYSLRRPILAFDGLAFGPLAAHLQTSVRVAPAVFGLGLLAAVEDATIAALADPEDGDGDGVSGRPNLVWDRLARATVPGRFGWKANVATIEEQVAGAFLGDIGITSPLFPVENCPPAQTACAAAPNGGVPEIDQITIDFVTFYSHTLAVPARRDVEDLEVRRGEGLFAAAGCVACHAPTLTTGDFPAIPALAVQTIHPYTDLLLHDMGEGLADGRPDFAADGREWRTAPLWGIGLVATVNEHTLLLHDGRARDLAEAVLWHGGEAEAAREAFRHMSRADRAALLRFLASL
jgi:CxxC motif-containing protein (DUF1111 family)